MLKLVVCPGGTNHKNNALHCQFDEEMCIVCGLFFFSVEFEKHTVKMHSKFLLHLMQDINFIKINKLCLHCVPYLLE